MTLPDDVVNEALLKLKAMRVLCESSGQPFYVILIDEVVALLSSIGAA